MIMMMMLIIIIRVKVMVTQKVIIIMNVALTVHVHHAAGSRKPLFDTALLTIFFLLSSHDNCSTPSLF